MNEIEMLQSVCRQFLIAEVISVRTLQEGHINDTFSVRTAEGDFVLQRLQSKMDPQRLLTNYELYAPVCEANGFVFPKWRKAADGSYFYTDADGKRWRMYPYIEGETLTSPLTEDQFYACGKGLAVLHKMLAKLPEKPVAVYPMLHDLPYYYERYCALLRDGEVLEESRDNAVEKQIAERSKAYTQAADKAVIHGDAKLSNIIFREGSVVGMLDWDTVMVGSVCEEIADCIRSCAVKGGHFDRKGAEALLNGYQSVSEMSEVALENIRRAFEKINFELALRYYTDAISKEKVFKEHYPGYRLMRVRELLQIRWT